MPSFDWKIFTKHVIEKFSFEIKKIIISLEFLLHIWFNKLPNIQICYYLINMVYRVCDKACTKEATKPCYTIILNKYFFIVVYKCCHIMFKFRNIFTSFSQPQRYKTATFFQLSKLEINTLTLTLIISERSFSCEYYLVFYIAA